MSGITLSIGLNYGGPKREMTVAYAPGGNEQKPMVRITNRLLLQSGFTVGSKCNVEYGNGIITIVKSKSTL